MWATIGKVVTAACVFLINILMTRLLSPQEVGAYYILTSVVIICALLAQFGTHQAIVRQLGSLDLKDLRQQKKIIKTTFVIVTIGSFFICVPFSFGLGNWVGNYFFSSHLVAGASVLAACWIFLRAFQSIISQVNRGRQCFFSATIFEGTLTSVLITCALGGCWVFSIDISLTEMLLITLGALIFSVIVGMYLLLKGYWLVKAEKGLGVYELLQISFPLFVISIAIPGVSEAHVWVLGASTGEEDVAVYGVAYRLAKFVVLPLLIINSVLPPIVAQLYSQNEKRKLESVLRATAAVAALPTLLVVTLLFFYSKEALTLLFGEIYSQGEFVLLLIVFAQAINVFTGSPGVLLTMTGYQRVAMSFALMSGVFGLITSLFLVSKFGFLGVALGVAVGMVSHNLGMWWYCKKHLDITTHLGVNALIESVVVFRAK